MRLTEHHKTDAPDGYAGRRDGAATPCESLDFVGAALRRRVRPLMFCRMDIAGHLDVERLKRAVALSAVTVPEILYACDFKKSRFVSLGHTADDVVRCVQGMPDLGSGRQPQTHIRRGPELPDLSGGPQLQICITPKEGHDLVSFAMSHILSDGRGFLQYLYLLAALYNGGEAGRNVRNLRDIASLLEDVRVLAPTQQTRYHRHSAMPPLRPGKKGGQFFYTIGNFTSYRTKSAAMRMGAVGKVLPDGNCVQRGNPAKQASFCLTSRIEADSMTAVHQKAKRSGATLNNVFLTAYARVIARSKRLDTVVLPCPADLRRFRTDLKELTVANMTGIYRKIAVEIPHESAFDETLQQVHLEMELQKSRRRCFTGMKPLDRAFRRAPRPLLGGAIRAAYRMPPVSYTNLGVIDHEKLRFEGCEVRDCFFTGSYRLPPDFQLTVSTFQNTCTLNCTLTGPVGDDEIGQGILDQVKNEILKWVECG